MKLFYIAAVAASFSAPALADGYDARIDDHAPIGVMADHAHKKGEFMTSLRYMHMDMGDPANTMMGPQSMGMDMFMAGMMYAPSDKVTLAAMIGYRSSNMDMIMGGNALEAEAEGFGDLRLSAIVPVVNDGKDRFLVTLGANIPTGGIDDTNPMGARVGLNMQAGSGSWGLTPSATYTRFFESWSVGAQINARLWLEDNKYGERLGDSITLTSWAAVQASDKVSFSGRVAYTHTDEIAGTVMPVDAREEVRAFAGVNTLVGSHRFALEAGLPLWQDEGANNLEAGFTLMAGWQKSF